MALRLVGQFSDEIRLRILNDYSFHDITLFVAASRLLLQDPSPLEGDAGRTSSSRKELVPRLYFSWPHTQLIDRVE